MHSTVRMDAIAEIGSHKRDSFLLCDIPGLADLADTLPADTKAKGGSWFGGQTIQQAIDFCRTGDLASVPAADAFMSELEGMVFVSRKFRVVDDVCGAVPNVPAFIAGIPTSMRRRARTVAQSAPLSVFVDLTSSASVGAADVAKRGTAILALVRLLANVRAVECWAFTGLGNGNGRTANYCAIRLDTAPLDLARAAHILTSTCVARGMGYKLCQTLGDGGDWPYADVKMTRLHGAAIMGRVVQPGSDVLYIPPVHAGDEAIRTPVAWLKDMLAEYGGQTVESE